MATQWFAHDDAMSVDEDEAQAPAAASILSTTGTSSSPNESYPSLTSAFSTTPSTSALLARLSARVDRYRNDPTDHTGAKFSAAFEPHPKHPSTTAFEAHIGATILELADFWFCQGSPYDHVCLARPNWRQFRAGRSVGDFLTRAELHLELYAYTLRRVSAVGILLARGYEVLDGRDGLSATDEAFRVVVEVLVLHWENLRAWIVDWPERGRGRTLMVDSERFKRALAIVMGEGRWGGDLGLPMRFAVKWKVREGGEGEGSMAGGGVGGGGRRGAVGNAGMASAATVAASAKEPDEVVFFRFKTARKGVQGGWETEMEVVAPGDANAVCTLDEYRLPPAL